jgi:hypothetical protein
VGFAQIGIQISASARAVCSPQFSHELEINWNVTGAGASVQVTITVTGPDGKSLTTTQNTAQGSIKVPVSYPGGGSVDVQVTATTATGSVLGSASATLEPCTGGSERIKVAYIYSTDVGTANEYKSLLEANGFQVDLILQSAVLSTDFAGYKYIVIGPETGSLKDWGDAAGAQVSHVNGPGRSILGLGEGGYAFFGRLALTIGWPQGWHGSEAPAGTGINVVDVADPVWTTPNPISIPSDGLLAFYGSSSPYVAIYNPDVIAGVKRLGRQIGDATHYPLIGQAGKYLLWGFGRGPVAMTLVGKQVFVNVLKGLP